MSPLDATASYLHQIFTDFKNYFTGTIPEKFAIKLLYYVVKYKFSKLAIFRNN